MITDSYDNSKPIITPENFYPFRETGVKTCIMTFSSKILDYVLSNFHCTEGPLINNVTGNSRIHFFEHEGQKLAIFPIRVGAPTASMDMITVHQFTGATNFIVFGSAGSLDREKTKGKYIVPSYAYRDEGISYHYVPASDYIEIKNADKISAIFEQKKIPHMKGRIWTTDALFMETENLFNRRKEDGCLAVDMEISGLQAVADYYGYNLFCFLETGDVLSGIKYEKAGLAGANHRVDKLFTALEIAKAIR